MGKQPSLPNKVALLERRFGSHDPRHSKTNWQIRYGVKWYDKDLIGQGNTFAFIDAFGEVMTGPLEPDMDYSPVKDYDLIYVRIRAPPCVVGVKQLREQCPDPVIIVYTDELANENIKNLCHGGWLYDASKCVDAITCGFPEKYDRPKFEKMGITNYVFCPYASSVYHWLNWWKDYEDKKNVVSGMWHIRSFMAGGCGDRIHSRTLKIMKYLQTNYDVECRFFLNFDGWKLETQIKKFAESNGLEVELVRHVDNNVFNNMMAESKIFIEEYQCPNYSRATVVSASVGTPQVGTDMNTPSNVLFPETTVPHGDWDGFVERCERLLTDDEFYNDVQAKALKRSSYFYYPRFRGRVLRMYNMIRNERNL